MTVHRAPVRVYAAVGVDEILAWDSGQAVQLPGGYAVTPAVRSAFPEDDEEELEYAALWTAAESVGARRGSGCTVVAALDISAPDLLPATGSTQQSRSEAAAGPTGFEVALAQPVPARRLACLHVLPSDAGEDEELSWYDVSELDAVVALVRG